MAKNTRSRRNKMSVGAQIALGATCVLAVGASAVCGVFAGFHPDAALAFFKGENIYTQASADATAKAAQDAGYDAGYAAGNKAGHDSGYNAGYDAGNNAGYDSGYNVGFEAGKDAGYNAGFEAGKAEAAEPAGVLQSNKTYDKIYFTTDMTVWNEVAEFVRNVELEGKCATILCSDNYMILAYSLGLFGGGAEEDQDEIIVMAQNLHDNYDCKIICTTAKTAFETDHMGTVYPGLNNLGDDGLFDHSIGRYIKMGYKEGSSPEIPLLPDELLHRVISSTPLGAYRPVL